MPLLIDNLDWMAWNIFLALIPLFFGLLVVRYSKNFLTPILFIVWILFFPNTIYLITDIEYLPRQFSATVVSFDILLIFQYLIIIGIGIMTYLWALHPIVRKFRIPEKLVYVFNFFVAFACALGKIQRTESWDVFVNPTKVLSDINRSLVSPQIILFVIFFGLLINFIWISGRIIYAKK